MRVETLSGGRIKVRLEIPGHRRGHALCALLNSRQREMQSKENNQRSAEGASSAEEIQKSTEVLGDAPSWFIKYMEQFRLDLQRDVSNQVVLQTTELLLNLNLCDIPKKHSQFAAAARHDASDLIHVGVICDHCKEPVRGIRYKCGNCVDYNLCSKCELRSGVHSDDHVFLKIRNPACMSSSHRRKDVPLLKHRVYKRGHAHLNSPSSGSNKHGSSGCFQSKRERKIKKTLKKLEKYSHFSEFAVHSEVSSELLLPETGRSSEEPAQKVSNAQFIRDESTPDGARVSPGVTFTKCWRIKNTGPTMWLSDTMLKNYWGSPGLTPHKAEVVVPPLLPGEEGTIMVQFSAPQQPGCYQSLWKLHHKHMEFGDDLWCKIEVKSPSETSYSRAPTLKLDAAKKMQEGLVEVLGAVHQEQEKEQLVVERKIPPTSPATPNNTPFDLTPPKSPEPKGLEPTFPVAVNDEPNKDLDTNYSTDGTDSDSTASILSISSSSDYDGDYVKIPISVPCSDHSLMFDLCSTPLVQPQTYDPPVNVGQPATPKEGEALNLTCKVVKTVSQETGEENSTSSAESQHHRPLKQPLLPQSLQCLSASALQHAPAKSLLRESSVPSTQEMPSVPLCDTRRVPPPTEPVLRRVPVVTSNPFLMCNPPTAEVIPTPFSVPSGAIPLPPPPSRQQTTPSEKSTQLPEESHDERVIQVLPDSLVNGVLTATASVYNTARAIWTTVQQRDDGLHQECICRNPGLRHDITSTTPPGQNVDHNRSPPVRENVDAHVPFDPTTPRLPLTPMEKLIEMGFCDRGMNRELLQKHNDDVSAAVAELITVTDNEWHVNRHSPNT